jgi:hypothetical protein
MMWHAGDCARLVGGRGSTKPMKCARLWTHYCVHDPLVDYGPETVLCAGWFTWLGVWLVGLGTERRRGACVDVPGSRGSRGST